MQSTGGGGGLYVYSDRSPRDESYISIRQTTAAVDGWVSRQEGSNITASRWVIGRGGESVAVHITITAGGPPLSECVIAVLPCPRENIIGAGCCRVSTAECVCVCVCDVFQQTGSRSTYTTLVLHCCARGYFCHVLVCSVDWSSDDIVLCRCLLVAVTTTKSCRATTTDRRQTTTFS